MLPHDFIGTTAVFSTRDYLEVCGDTQANRNLLSRAVKAEKVSRIKQGLYASNAGKYRGCIHSRYEIVQASDPMAVFCYNSAFELFAGQHNLVSAVTFFTGRPVRPFVFQNRTYRMFPLPKEKPKTRGYRQVDGTVVRGTTPEQTIIDSLAKPDRCFGIENVLRIVSTLSTIDVEGLFGLLEKETSPTRARTGWILEQKKKSWHIPEARIIGLQESLGKGPFYFTPDHLRAQGAYDARWHLYFSEPILTFEGWING